MEHQVAFSTFLEVQLEFCSLKISISILKMSNNGLQTSIFIAFWCKKLWGLSKKFVKLSFAFPMILKISCILEWNKYLVIFVVAII